MATYNGHSYQDPRNINLRGGVQGAGLIRWDRNSHPGLWATNPFASDEIGLYVNNSGNLVFSYLGAITTLGTTGGSGSVPSLDAIFAGDQTLDLGSASTLTIDRSSGNNDVLTLTNTGAGSGDTLQITNVGTGKDVNGTGGTWSFSKLGAGVALTLTLTGTDAANSFTLSAGDAVITDGSFTLTDADNAASFSVTNNTATSASVVVIAGSGVFTGSTTSSFMTITASGLTTGTAVYVPVAALTTGKGFHLVGNALTSGNLVAVTSSATAITGAGRLFLSSHSGATGTSATLNEFSSAATDETVIVKVTASAALALGVMLQVSGSSVTTGKGITVSDFDALTTGIAVHIASAATAITTTGRLLYSNHTGATGTTAILNEFASAANDETEIVKITASDVLAAGKALNISVASMTTGTAILVTGTAVTSGKGLDLSGFNALTTGIMLNLTSSATAITGAGRMLYVNHTGATGTSATLAEVASAATDETVIFKVTASAANALGTAVSVSTATTTGNGIAVVANSLTDGFGLSVTSSATGMTSTGRLLNVNHSGNAGVSTIVAEVKSAAADETVILQVTASAALAGGKAVFISAAALTTGIALDISGSTATTTGTLINVNDNSADTGTRSVVKIKQDHASASGATALEVLQDGALAAIKVTSAATSTNYFKIATMNGVTLWMGNGTTANTFLSGTAGDILFNGGSNKPEYCTGTTNWTALV